MQNKPQTAVVTGGESGIERQRLMLSWIGGVKTYVLGLSDSKSHNFIKCDVSQKKEVDQASRIIRNDCHQINYF